MTPEQLIDWRKRLGLNKKQAAAALGLAYDTYRNYEAGRRRGSGAPVPIPKPVALACAALALGLEDYPGA